MKLRLLILICAMTAIMPSGQAGAGQKPVQIRNMEKMEQGIRKKINETRAGLERGEKAYEDRIWSARTYLHDMYKDLIRGGAPQRCRACMNTSEWARFKKSYEGFNNELERLEREYLRCTYGLKMDGKVVNPPLTWTEDQWKAKLEASTHQAHRCWLLESKKPDDYEF